MADETKQDAPIAPGLDSWWQNGPAVDKAAAEEAAVLAEDFRAERVQTYLESGAMPPKCSRLPSPPRAAMREQTTTNELLRDTAGRHERGGRWL